MPKPSLGQRCGEVVESRGHRKERVEHDTAVSDLPSGTKVHDGSIRSPIWHKGTWWQYQISHLAQRYMVAVSELPSGTKVHEY